MQMDKRKSANDILQMVTSLELLSIYPNICLFVSIILIHLLLHDRQHEIDFAEDFLVAIEILMKKLDHFCLKLPVKVMIRAL